jgi:hypothetical protein
MIKKTFKVAFVLGAMLISTSSFADLVEKDHMNGRADMTKIQGTEHTYKLDCTGTKSRCYTTYTSGDIAIHLSGGDIFVHLVTPAPPDVPPTYVPDPADPNGFLMMGSLTVELNPGQILP